MENIGGDATEAMSNPGSGVGEARFAFLIILFLIVGKFRALLIVPATIAGFFTYQLGSLIQGIKDIDD